MTAILRIQLVTGILNQWVSTAQTLLLYPILHLRDTMRSMHTRALILRQSFPLISKTSRIHLQVICERSPNLLKMVPLMTFR